MITIMVDRQPHRILIVDDEPLGRALIRDLLRGYEDVEVIGEAHSAEQARGILETSDVDLMFLDVQMPDETGIELMRRLGPDAPYVIFVTAHAEFAVSAFELHATDYLLKPVQQSRFRECLRRATGLIALERRGGTGGGKEREDYPRRLTFKVRRRLVAIDLQEVAWIEGANQYCRIHSSRGEYLLSKSLAMLEPELDPSQFYRIHRSAIINASHLRAVRSDGTGRYFVSLCNGEELPVGRARRAVVDVLAARAVPAVRSDAKEWK